MEQETLKKILKKNKWYDFGNGEYVKHQLKIKLSDDKVTIEDIQNIIFIFEGLKIAAAELKEDRFLQIKLGDIRVRVDLKECYVKVRA